MRRWLLFVMVFACSREQSIPTLRNANLLLITLDTTRADHIGAYGYTGAQTPHLDALAAEGVLFEQCITPTAYTLPSHSSIMTGRYPPFHGVRLNGAAALGDEQITLAERLTEKGYRTGAFVGAFVLDGRWGLSQGFQHYDDKFILGPDQRLDLARVQRPADRVVDAAIDWVKAHRGQPFFAWLHLYDAHTPYEPPEPYRSRFPNAPYDGEIAFADAQVGRLLEWLEREGLKNNTIVAIVGDHGEGLGSHGESEHGYFIYDYAVRVPLVMRIPGTSPTRVRAQVRTIDLLPTLTDFLAGESPAAIQGQSLRPLISGDDDTPRSAYSESMATRLQYGWSALYSLRTDDHKFIDAPRSELYELKSDPGEARNRLDDLRRVAVKLRDELRAIREEGERNAPQHQEANLDEETVRQLAALGYLGGGSTTLADDKDLADPKDKIHLFESIGYAAHLASKDDHEQAAEVLRIVLNDDPDIPQAQLLLATSYRKLKRTAEAKSILDAYLRRDPGSVQALIAMAEILAQEGKHDEVVAICKRALAEDAKNARAYELMAEHHMAQKEHAEALPLLRKVVEIQPKLTRSRNNLAAALIALGQLREAEQLLGDIVREYPKFPLTHFHLALIREREGRLADARAEYETELRNHDKSVVARFNLGALLMRQNDIAGAEKAMRTLIAQDPDGARQYLFLGRILLARGQLDEVERLAQAGLARAKEPELKALGYFLLADVYSREGRRRELDDAVRKGKHFQSMM